MQQCKNNVKFEHSDCKTPSNYNKVATGIAAAVNLVEKMGVSLATKGKNRGL
jgi:hypothetical protein